MIIGSDYDKLELQLFGFDLLEPNTFIGDVVIFALSIFLAYKTTKLSAKGNYFLFWKWFFIVFGISFIAGGFGHLFYNYWSLPGKYLGWYSGMVATMLIEIAFLSIFPIDKWRNWLTGFAIVKMSAAFISEGIVLTYYDLSVDQSKGLFIPTLNSVLGLALAFGVLATYYKSKIDNSFRLFHLCILVLVPPVFFQLFKINFAQWFDRNDVSHVMILVSLLLYFYTIRTYAENMNKGASGLSQKHKQKSLTA